MTEAADSPLLAFLLAVLSSIMTPGLGNAGIGDAGLARRAAVQAIEAYQARGTHELIAIGQILSFAMAALDTLRLSAPPDVSLSMKLKLRGNANGLNGAARDNTRILDGLRTQSATVFPKLTERAVVVGLPGPGGVQPAKVPPADWDNADWDNTVWASAMNTVAAKLRADTQTATPDQRTVNALWIDALTGVAKEVAGNVFRTKDRTASGGGRKAVLLRTTHLASASPNTQPMRSDLNRDGISGPGAWMGRVGTVTSQTDGLSDRDKPAT
jgi:hypothetical protein